MPSTTLYFEDLAVGQQFVTQGRTITETDVTMFATWAGDSPSGAGDREPGAGPVPDAVRVPDLIGPPLAMGLVSRLGRFEGSAFAFLAVEGWTCREAIRVGDTLHCLVEVTGLRLTSSGDAGVLHRRLTLVNQRGGRVQDGAVTVLIARRPHLDLHTHLLETRALTREFSGFRAVSDVDLAVPEGEIHALVGPNGAGKTTLFNMLTGFLTPTSGQILFCGQDITGKQPETIAHLGVARSFQITSLFEEMSLLEHLELALASSSRPAWRGWLEGSSPSATASPPCRTWRGRRRGRQS